MTLHCLKFDFLGLHTRRRRRWEEKWRHRGRETETLLVPERSPSEPHSLLRVSSAGYLAVAVRLMFRHMQWGNFVSRSMLHFDLLLEYADNFGFNHRENSSQEGRSRLLVLAFSRQRHRLVTCGRSQRRPMSRTAFRFQQWIRLRSCPAQLVPHGRLCVSPELPEVSQVESTRIRGVRIHQWIRY